MASHVARAGRRPAPLIGLVLSGLLLLAPSAATPQPAVDVPADVLGTEVRVPRAPTERSKPEKTMPDADAGPGLSWRVRDRLEFFGEYRFLHLRGDDDDPLFRAGFSIRLY